MKKHIPVVAALCAVALFALAGCATTPQEIQTDLSPAEFFQKAQEAADAGRYVLAMRYYETFREQYPNELERNLWARYEIAFLHHKMGDNDEAVRLFNQLLADYDREGQDWPQGPRILAQQVKKNIEEGRRT